MRLVQHSKTRAVESQPPQQHASDESSSHPHREQPVLALVPAYNEEKTIATIVTKVRETLPVLVVDDGSGDGTAGAARDAGATVVSHETNKRKGAALMTGFRWAMAHGYEAVVTLDADGQHDPADLPALLQAHAEGAGDLIIGERDFAQMPFPRTWSSPFGARLLSRALGTRVTDNQSGYRLLTRRFLERMHLQSRGFEMEVEMIWEAIRLGCPIAWVPVRTIYFPERKSGFHPVKDSARFASMVWRIWRQRRRWEKSQHRAPTGQDGTTDAPAPRTDRLGRVLSAIDGVVRRWMGVYEFSDDPQCLFRLERRRAKDAVPLPDGTAIERGETLGIIHLIGDRVPALPPGGADLAWAKRTSRAYTRTFVLLAAHVAETRALDDVRVFGNTFTIPVTQGSVRMLERVGFMVVREDITRLTSQLHERLARFWTQVLRRAYNPISLENRAGSAYGTLSMWMTRDTLMTRYGPDA